MGKPTIIVAVVILVMCLWTTKSASSITYFNKFYLMYNESSAAYLLKMMKRHAKWMSKYGRVYSDNFERENSFLIFVENVEFIESFNKVGTHSYKLAVNKFADLRISEYEIALRWRRYTPPSNRLNRRKRVPSSATSSVFRCENVTVVPASVDWRENGAVARVKYQGQCGISSFR